MDHNNGLEAKNGDLKKTKVLRNKQPIGTFYKNCKEIVYKESKLNDKDNRLICDPMDLITLNNQTEGWKWLQTKKLKTVKVPKLEKGSGGRGSLDQFPSLTVFFYLKASLSQYSTTCREAVKFWPDKL